MVTLVELNDGIFDVTKVRCSNDFNSEARGLVSGASRGLCLFELSLQFLGDFIVLKDGFFEFSFSVKQLILGIDIVVHEFVEIHSAIIVSVAFLEEFVDNLDAVFFVDPLLAKELKHLFFSDLTVPVDVDCMEFLPEHLDFVFVYLLHIN